ncbi:Histidinol dehydrogenase [hydrothermal vent metagenome]|uniref:Histidinol dehydrogenase n=1 Tax=hydrothermal vent metagenome TaxID=652676 RepID=A0A3B1DR43_9ZZZZ
MTPPALNITTINSQQAEAATLLQSLRDKLSPQGDVVSTAGKQQTIDLFGEPLSPQQVVKRICEDVRSGGLTAVLDYTAKLDKKTLTRQTIQVTEEEFNAAHQAASPEFLETIRRIRENITEFQNATMPSDVSLSRMGNHPDSHVELRQRFLPMKRIGICVPGGAAAYPSTLLMTAVPAQVAGVKEIVVVVPPTKFGGYNNDILAVCKELGVTEVYRIGGAQAVAAMAYGVEGILPVDKIVGPGNLFVALAKKYVFGDVDIDSIAGPSEVVVLADETANASYVASDLISQAEHSPGASILITWHETLIDHVKQELEKQLKELPRGDLAQQSLEQFGAFITVANQQEAAKLSDLLAPEHLHISTSRPEEILQQVQNAGAIFMGHHTPVALGDYFAGPSHVLPTGGTARFANGLAASDFLKRSSIITYNQVALQEAAEDVIRMATKEGLTGHANSVEIRLPKGT